MKTICNYNSDSCRYEIVKIQNGWLIVFTGISERNEGYKDAIYYKDKSECWESWKSFIINTAGGKIFYGFDDIDWGGKI